LISIATTFAGVVVLRGDRPCRHRAAERSGRKELCDELQLDNLIQKPEKKLPDYD
jgi:hypothetical protein